MANTITTTAGTPQTAAINSDFPTRFQVSVTDINTNPVADVTVTFTAPSGAASGTFSSKLTANVTTDASGLATAPTFTANATAGNYAVTVTAPDVADRANFALGNTSSDQAASLPAQVGITLVASDGGIFAFGDAGFFGSTGGVILRQPILGMAGAR